MLDYNFTANVENDFDEIAEGKEVWNEVIGRFYAPFHKRVEEVEEDRNYTRVERELGTAPDGQKVTAKYGQWGPYVQKGEGEDRKFASLGQGQLIESITLEEALKLFDLPRTVGTIEGTPVIATKGRYGPYLKFGDKNISIPKGTDPLNISLEECKTLIEKNEARNAGPLAQWGDIQVLNGRYGPYIKFNGSNYKIPKGTDAGALTETECKDIIANSEPSKKRGFRKKS